VRELVGDDGEAIAVYMVSVMHDEKARTAEEEADVPMEEEVALKAA
jgi:hypothetical protein